MLKILTEPIEAKVTYESENQLVEETEEEE